MLVSVQSTNADEYNKVSVNLNILWKCIYVKYHVSSISTISNILLVNEEDYLDISSDNKPTRTHFTAPKFHFTI